MFYYEIEIFEVHVGQWRLDTMGRVDVCQQYSKSTIFIHNFNIVGSIKVVGKSYLFNELASLPRVKPSIW